LGAWYLWRLNDNSRPFPPLSWEYHNVTFQSSCVSTDSTNSWAYS
jgi:hypothetical protein